MALVRGERERARIQNVPIFDPLLWFSTTSIESNSNQSNPPLSIYPIILQRDYNNNTSYSTISSWIQYSEFPIMAEVRTAIRMVLLDGRAACVRVVNNFWTFSLWLALPCRLVNRSRSNRHINTCLRIASVHSLMIDIWIDVMTE